MLLNRIFAVCAVGLLMCGGLFADIAITNPSFELPALGGGYSYLGNGTVNGWAYAGGAGVTGNYNAFTLFNSPAPNGSQVLFLQGNGASASQALTGFQTGVQYNLSFYLSTRQGYSLNQTLNVTLDNQTLFAGLTPAAGAGYTLESILFSTSAGSHTLEFAGFDTGGDTTVFLDNVSITSAATPEPGLYGMMALGLSGLVAAIRRRKSA